MANNKEYTMVEARTGKPYTIITTEQKANMIEHEAQDIFDKQWYPAHVLTGEVVEGKIKIEWTATGFISWVEPERLRIAQAAGE